MNSGSTGSTTTIRVRRETRDRLKELAKRNKTTISNIVMLLLEREVLSEKLDTIISLLRERNELLRELIRALRSREYREEAPYVRTIEVRGEEDLPSFVRDNPWIEILKRVGERKEVY